MLFKKLHTQVPSELSEIQITGLSFDSRNIKSGDLFFAIEGSKDGHDFLEAVAKQGCAVAVVRKGHPSVAKVKGLLKTWAVENPRQTMAECAASFYGNPSQSLQVVGVTGTNGKTTTTFLLESILQQAQLNPAVIGTVECRLGDYKVTSTHTTPDAITLQSLFADFQKRGAKSVSMEVSSHALDQHRVWGTQFKAALFTNLTPDHLDYHQTMEAYFAAKAKFFLEHKVQNGIVHTKDEYGKKLFKACQEKGVNVFSFGPNGAHLNYGTLQVSAKGIEGTLEVTAPTKCRIPIRSKLLGGFNVENIAGVVLCGLVLGLTPQQITQAIENAKPVPGRMQQVPNKAGLTVVVDYAHTPDALEKALKTLRPLTHGKLYCVFGCGGDRDQKKRPLMGTIAESLADHVILTNDNPRSEKPDEILNQIAAGMKKGQHEKIEDRKEAIEAAIKGLKAGDILLIAGKGHEDYQIIGSQKSHFDDVEVASVALARK